MTRKPVKSGNIQSVGYDPDSKVLEVEFRGGSVYQYLEVEDAAYQGLMKAASPGRYLHTMIKDNYEYRRVT